MGMKEKRLHIILATTLFAIFLWVSVKLGDQYQFSVHVPLTIEHIPPGTAPKSNIPRTVLVRFRGEGWRLAGLFFSNDLKCIVDLNTLPSQQQSVTLNDVVDRLSIPVGVQAFDMDPDSLYVAFDSVGYKKVPVLLDYTASFKDHYGQVGPTVISPESVVVEGARSVIENINSWATAHQQFENLKDPVNALVPLLPSEAFLLNLSPAEVRVTIDVQWFAEKVFAGVPVEVLSVPPHREVILVPPRIEVVVRGGVNQLAALSLNDFRSSVDYGVLLSDTTGTIEPEVVIPQGTQMVNKRPGQLQYVIRKRL